MSLIDEPLLLSTQNLSPGNIPSCYAASGMGPANNRKATMVASKQQSRSIHTGLLIICIELLVFCTIGTMWFYQSPRALSKTGEENDTSAENVLFQSFVRSQPRPKPYDGLIEVEVPSIASANQKKPNADIPPHYLFNQPFYVYEDLLMLNATANGETIENMIERKYTWKHNDDIWFVNAALKHPMRTRNPEEAVLFVVPSFTNIFLSPYDHRNACVGDELCGMEYIIKVNEMLGESPWFQRNEGRDHVVVATMFWASWYKDRFPNYLKCNMIALENRKWNNDGRHSVPSYYVGTACLPRTKEYDFAMIASLKPAFTFDSRRHICEWLSQDRPQYSVPVCGEGGQCPTLAQARFGFHVRGDTYGANRLIDTILSGTVPIFTMKEQYDVLPDWIRWDDFSYFADVNDKETFLRTLDDIMSDTALYEKKHAALMANRELFDWTTNTPFDTYMYMFMAEIYPQYRRPQSDSPFSALQLSKPDGFDVFDPETKQVWCGPSGPAPTCGECRPLEGTMTKGCRRMCKWCDFGYAEEPESTFLSEPDGICVPRHYTCKQPSYEELLEHAVQAYQPLSDDFDWCFDEKKDVENIHGLLLAKTYKTGSSTAAAVTLQIAHRLGRRKGYSRPCVTHHDHDLSRFNAIARRAKEESLVWTTVRDPKARALSSFSFYQAGRQAMEPTDGNLMKTLYQARNNQIAQLRTKRAPSSPGGQPTDVDAVPESPLNMYKILKEEISETYNFIAVTERMEESLVVMKLLWGLEDGDIIVTSVKQSGEWSYDWDKPETCFHVPKIKPSSAVQEYLDRKFRKRNYDFVLYDYANRSLDATIESLGRERVQREVEKYRGLKERALRYCKDKIRLPCSDEGEWQADYVESCFEDDIGCGYQCINDFLDSYKQVDPVIGVASKR